MDYVLYFMGLIAVALLSCGLTKMVEEKRELKIFWEQVPKVNKLEVGQLRATHQWYWWVGFDSQLKKEFLIAAVGKDAKEAQMLLGPRNLELSRSSRVQGGTRIDRSGRHVLVARSLSEINMEGN